MSVNGMFLKVAVVKSKNHDGMFECQIRTIQGEVLIYAIGETEYKAVKRLRQLADFLEKDVEYQTRQAHETTSGK